MNNSLFETLTNENPSTGRIMMPKVNRGIVGKDNEAVPILHPIINRCLSAALKNIVAFRKQAKEIIEAGIEINHCVASKVANPSTNYFIDENGFLLEGRTIVASVIYTNITSVGDKDIDANLRKLKESLSPFNLKR